MNSKLFILTLINVCICVSAGGCGGGDGGDRTTSKEITFDNWDAFVSSEELDQISPGHVVVIGIDGAPWHYVNRLIDQGRLPNLARIKREGAYASLRSTQQYVTPPAWTSMFTGYAPEQTGIYSFGRWDSDAREFIAVNSDDVKVPFVWDAASRSGMKTGVFNVPMTYPVHPVNGAVVSGMMTPIEAAKATNVRQFSRGRWENSFRADPTIVNFSPPLKTALGDSANAFLFVIHDTTDDNITNYDRLSLRVLSRLGADAQSPELGFYAFSVGEYSPWLPIKCRTDSAVVSGWGRLKLEITESNRVHLEFSQTLMPIDVVYTYPKDLHDTLARRFGFYLPTFFLTKEVVPALTDDMAEHATFFYDFDDWDLFHFVFTQSDNIHHLVGFSESAAEVYTTIDRAVGEIMGKMPEGGTLIVASDHGNGEFEYGIDLNSMFTQLGLLRWETPHSIDHENTLVFHNLWQVYFNHEKISREELATRGIDVPEGEDPLAYLIDYVIAAGRQLRTPDGSRYFPVEFHRSPESGEKDDPEMWVVGTYGDYFCDYWNIMTPHMQTIRELQGGDRIWHIPNGIFLAWGEGIRGGYDAGTKQIADVAPTILFLAGLPVAPDMAGVVMDDIFTRRYAANRLRFINTGYRDIPKERLVKKEDRQSLQKKLRSLGYIR